MTITNRIWVDFMKADGTGRIWLTTIGTQRDLKRLGIQIQEGLPLKLWTDDLDEAGKEDNLIVDGVAHFYEEAGVWVALVDWNDVHHESESGACDAEP